MDQITIWILCQVLLEAGDGLLKIIEVRDDGGGFVDLLIELNRSKLESVGVKAIGRLLLEMQVTLSTPRRTNSAMEFSGTPHNPNPPSMKVILLSTP